MKWDKILKLLGIILVTAVVAVAAVKPLIPGPMASIYKFNQTGTGSKGGVHVVLEAMDTPEAPVTADRQAGHGHH